jgi:ribosomal-protein-alanine N-acetyltransferase
MTADHLPDIERIEKSTFRDPWPVSAFRNLIIQTKTNWVALRDGDVAGYAVTQWVLDEIHILNLATAKKFQRHGVASALLEFLLDRGRKKGMRDLFLEVRASNEAAQKLYEKFGFTKLNIRKRYYPDGEDALILHKRLVRQTAKGRGTQPNQDGDHGH